MEISWDLRPVVFKPFKSAYFFARFPLVPSLQNLREWAIWGSLRNLSYLGFAGTFGAAVCAEKWPDDWSLSAFWCEFHGICAQLFSSPLSRPTFWPSFPWSPLCKISENERFGCPFGICHNSALRALLEPPFAPKSCPMIALKVDSNEDFMRFAPSFFQAL